MNGPLDGLVVSGARDGRVAVDGRSKLTRYRVAELARRVEGFGIAAIIQTAT